MLNYAIVNGIIDLSAIQDSIIMNERKNITTIVINLILQRWIR